MVERSLVRDRRAAGEERGVDDVAVPDYPADVRGRPPDVVGAEPEAEASHRVDPDLVAAVRMDGELRLRRRPRRGEDECGLVRLQANGRRVLPRGARQELVPAELPPACRPALARSPQDDEMLAVAAVEPERVVHDGFEGDFVAFP